MQTHVTDETLRQLRHGRLPAAEVLAATRHLGTCAACAAMAAKMVDVPHAVSGIASELETPPRRAWMIPLAAAAAIAVMATGVLVLREPREEPITTPPTTAIRVTPPTATAPRMNEWDTLVASALAARRIDPPALLREIRVGPERLRNRGSGEPHARLEPTGVVVASDRPRFTWPRQAGARYVVSVYAGDVRLAASPLLRDASWIPPEPLPRGRTLTWQVDARAGETSTILPSPPAPPALFRIAEQRELDELARARRERPNDHLLLAVLHARAGMQAEALRELRAHVEEHPEERHLLDSVERWPE